MHKYIAAGLISILTVLLLITTTHTSSMVFDEPLHIASGYTKLTGDYRLNTEQPILSLYLMGLSVSLAQPIVNFTHQSWTGKDLVEFSQRFFFVDNTRPAVFLFLGRLPSITLTILLAIIVFLLAKQLYGPWAGILALALLTFEPNILAHGSLATTDMPFTAFLLLTTFAFLHYLKTGKKFWIFTITFALLQLTKYTAVIMIPFFLSILIIHALWKHVFWKTAKNLIILASITWLVICTAYTFQGVGIPMDKLVQLDPHLAQEYKTLLPQKITRIPSPLPYHYLKGLGFVLMEGKNPTLNKMFEQYSTTGFKTYFLTAFALKTTIGLIALILFSTSLTISSRKITLEETIILSLAAFLLLTMSFSTKQIGIRYVLPVYPLLIIFTSKLAQKCTRQGILCTAIIFLTIHTIAAGVSALPIPLNYYNELLGPENGWKAFADSNTDWGQDVNKLVEYLQNNTADTLSVLTTQNLTFYNITLPTTSKTCQTGRHIISAYHLFIGNTQWLQKYNFTERIGTSIFVYNIKNCNT